MRISTTRVVIVGLSVVAAGLLSACTAEQSATVGPSSTSAPTASSTSADADQTEPDSSAPPEDGGNEGVNTGEPAPDGSGANCGKVKGTNGQVDVVTDDTSAGTVGCVEAINVITEYFQDAPTKGQGTAYALTVDGWSCLMDTGAQGSGAVGCDKDGLTFHTQA